ncbi:uncharacterized protein LOC120215606 [Hibiscus syriacus]|uniref:uncharacterized protein LOC120215606 n=1 Tax=Hibiscus syriacus TaxID=106335 RepID=UPI001920F603|nr:uncharacterized protein LOC120215606 [Hibiscus syriacus]
MEENGNRGDAKRCLAIAEKLLRGRHLKASREAAVIAQQNDPLLEGPDQILAVINVLIAAAKRINEHRDWYSILQVDCPSQDKDLINKQYHRLALLLDPETNDFPFADNAFKLVTDAWSILSNTSKKSLYDKDLDSCTRTNSCIAGDRSNKAGESTVTRGEQNQELKKKRMPNSEPRNENQRPRMSTFWTACPYCYRLFEYPRIYQGCCLRCQNCDRAFHGVLIPTLPPMIPEKEAYYCNWAFFPLISGDQEDRMEAPPGFPVKRRESERKGGTVASPPQEAAPKTTSKKAFSPSGGQESRIKPPPGFPVKRRESERDGGAVATPPQAAAPRTTTDKASKGRDNAAASSGRNPPDFAPRKKGRPM